MKTIDEKARVFEKMESLYTFVDAIPDIYMILDSKRQLVYANHAMHEFLKNADPDLIQGRMPGDLLNCRHAKESEFGCGSTETCKTCGAFKAIASSLAGKSAIEECRIEQYQTGDALDLKVFTTPYTIENERYTILALNDISHEKRRQALERIFFHDILNTAGSLYGMAQLLNMDPDEVGEYKDIIYGLTEKLIDEINSQKMLASAENQELQAIPTVMNSLAFVEDMVGSYRKHYAMSNRDIQIDSAIANIEFSSDKTLLRRVVLNMLKNAVEAAPSRSTITIGCTEIDDRIEFWVHNSSFIPREIQLQIFKRSFSTKGLGRGLGTYSMKLLSERYLKGNVRFESKEDFGTVFTANYPKYLTSEENA